eukprot:1765516-Heterocapsa_arctica.AAC.1
MTRRQRCLTGITCISRSRRTTACHRWSALWSSSVLPACFQGGHFWRSLFNTVFPLTCCRGSIN